jgi:hypothetical protein
LHEGSLGGGITPRHPPPQLIEIASDNATRFNRLIDSLNARLTFYAGALFAQQPILYSRGAVNAASLAPFGLPNSAIAAGSIFTIFGENLGPVVGQTAAAFLS